ncbi:MAG: NfeD family protein [Sulfurimonas sp.]|jgi:hypothetical protein
MSYFIWLIFVVIAVVIEMILPTFFALFAGVGFLGAGVCAYFFPESLFAQLIIASLFMVIGAIIFKQRHIADSTTAGVGTHNEFVGIMGKTLTYLTEHQEGDVELYESVVSNRKWKALSVGGKIEAGEEIQIVEVRGNTLIVEKQIKG